MSATVQPFETLTPDQINFDLVRNLSGRESAALHSHVETRLQETMQENKVLHGAVINRAMQVGFAFSAAAATAACMPFVAFAQAGQVDKANKVKTQQAIVTQNQTVAPPALHYNPLTDGWMIGMFLIVAAAVPVTRHYGRKFKEANQHLGAKQNEVNSWKQAADNMLHFQVG